MPEKLPRGWVKANLAEVCLPVAHIQPEHFPDTEFTYFDIGSVDNEANRIVEPKTVTGRSAPSRARQALRNGDILFSTVRTYLRKIAMVESDYLNPLGSTGFAVIRAAEGVSSQFLFFQVLSDSFLAPLHALQTGSSYPAIRASDLFAQPILLAPTHEQEKIAATLDTAFSALGRADTATRRAVARLQRYRSSVLRAAIAGELSRAWREDYGRKSEATVANGATNVDDLKSYQSKRLAFMTGDLPQLPERWSWATVEDVGEVRLGRQRSPRRHTGKHMRPYLRVANVFEDRIDISDVKRMNFTPKEFEVYHLKKGDILLNEGQSLELVGRPAMYRNEIPDCCFQNTLIRFRARGEINRDFALIVFRAYLHNGQFAKIAKITTNLAHLDSDRFAQLEFPVPPLAEQSEIVREVGRRLTAANLLAAKLERHLLRTRATRQSLLRQAFTGRLVPQDQTNEPASLVLEHIRAARETEISAQKAKHMPRANFEKSASGRRDLLTVLKKNGGPMSPEELFRDSGHSQESVDEFFAELRVLTASPAKVVEDRKTGTRITLRAVS
jgi:type I restriction enzyme S subunit